MDLFSDSNKAVMLSFLCDSSAENASVPSSSQEQPYEGIPRSDHVIPGFHVYDGVPYAGVFPKEALDDVKKFQFRDDDVVLAGYPKSGMTNRILWPYRSTLVE